MELRYDALLDAESLPVREFERKYDDVEINDGKVVHVRLKDPRPSGLIQHIGRRTYKVGF